MRVLDIASPTRVSSFTLSASHRCLVLLERAVEFRRVTLSLEDDAPKTTLEHAVVSVPEATLQLARVLKRACVARSEPHGNIPAKTFAVPWPQSAALVYLLRRMHMKDRDRGRGRGGDRGRGRDKDRGR